MADGAVDAGSSGGNETSGTGENKSDNIVSLGSAISEATERGDIGSIDNPGSEGTVKRKRGRPVGWRKDKDGTGTAPKGTTKTANAVDANAIKFSLSGIHALLAAFLSTPEIALNETEADLMSKSIANVQRHYNWQASQKAMDWGNAVVAIGGIYSLKLMAVTARRNAEGKARRASAPAMNVPVEAPSMKNDGTTRTVHHPTAAGKPNGAAPQTRKAEMADMVMLDEPSEMAIF